MSLRSKGLVLAMEDDTEVEGNAEALIDSAPEVEAASDEIEQTEGDVGELTEAMGSAESDADTLEDIHDVMEESVEKGEGLDETAAEIAEVAIESICARLGIRNTRIMPATESFGSSNSRLTATKLAMEGIKETIAKIWEAIKAAAIRIWDKIVQFFTGVTKNVESLSKHLENLKARVEKLDAGAKTKEADLENSALARTFSDKKKADLGTAEKIIKHTINMLDKVESLTQPFKLEADHAQQFLTGEPKVAEYKKLKDDTSSAVDKAVASFQMEVVTTLPGAKDKQKGSKYYGPLAGTRCLVVGATGREVDLGDAGKELIVNTTIGISTFDKIEATKIKALKPDEMRTLIASGEKLVDALDAFNKRQAKLKELNDAIKKVSDVGLAAVKKEAESDTQKSRIMRTVSSDINSLNTTMSSISLAIPAAAFAAAKGVADYVSASIANLTTAK